MTTEGPASQGVQQCGVVSDRIFEELPRAHIVSVSRPDTADISPMLLAYTIELQYKQFKWTLVKKASQVLYLHFALKKRAFMEELFEKQEQVREWLYSLGIADHVMVVPDDDEPDDGALPISHEERHKRHIPSKAALNIIRPTMRKQHSASDAAKAAMQNYLNHFLGNLDIVNSREVCKFLEVSKLSFSSEYGPKMKEGYVMAKNINKLTREGAEISCCPFQLLGCCNNSWQKVWAVLKPGFLAFLEDPFDTEALDIMVFDILPTCHQKGMLDEKGKGNLSLADQIKERNPLYYAIKVSCGNRWVNLRMMSYAKMRDWISAINGAALNSPEGWCHPHRYSSFAPKRGLTEDGSQVQWFVDGEAAFDAVASAIEGAKSEIFMTGWWLCPELYLRRPFENHPSSRLDALLEAKAKAGVQIYILMYKEVPLALKINSMYSKKKLLNIHENVKVLRYPDHLSSGIYYWSHHEKIVIVDYQTCFLGGLDLCFGRFDTAEHRVADNPSSLWPGKDYYNPRESEPNSWEDAMADEVDRKIYPRMPWHDIQCALWGPPCRDVARHFVQRWNHAKRNKAQNEHGIPLLIPRHHMVLPHYMGKSSKIDVGHKDEEDNPSFRNEGFFSPHSLVEDIPLLLPQETDVENLSRFKQTEHDVVIHHEHQAKNDDEDQWEGSDGSQDEHLTSGRGDVGPRTACRCQVIRSASQWSVGTSQTEDSIHKAYCSLIENAEHFVYIENQFFISGLAGDDVIQNRVLDAIYKRILQAHKEGKAFRVIIVLPLLPGFQGGIDDSGAATVRAILHWQCRTISRGKNSILHNIKAGVGDKAHDYISFFGLRSHGRLFENGPIATSQVYVHSKLLIVDDRISVIGSSNINDRSLLGSRDSEIAVVIEDKEFVDSTMNGELWKAGKFSHSLRCSLWMEHLGLHPGEAHRVKDPLSDSTYRDLWLATAKENNSIYHDVFNCIPNDSIRSRAALRQSMSQSKERVGQNTIDLGIAPQKVVIKGGEGNTTATMTTTTDPMERLRGVKGHLVSFPLEFMCQEDLRPMLIEGEFYAAPQVFH
ncbi:hypothetical protein MLD38_010537 [Melastoma candidum]|uniref:Uncharacterized protein n=1 Tax=Melastoma candidum TaxID=119954 RepID=A0ACB9R0R3_9MYRT|nr:hypothetical protein MLD38_010537 [Melastoma candidum]